MKLPLYQVDAFTSEVFGGNPAGVVPLDAWLPDATMQSIAAENNLAETAFFVREPSGFRIRWFSPGAEVNLCGHATLASAHVLFTLIEPGRASVEFASKGGTLRVKRDGDRLALDFPSLPPVACPFPPGLVEALGATPRETHKANDLLVLFDTEAEIRALKPDFREVLKVDARGIVVTAKGGDVDFVSRFFVPSLGVDEDPATGSSHCTLIPFWAAKLGKNALRARQVSKRGGEFWCELAGDRVKIAGHVSLYLEGTITVG